MRLKLRSVTVGLRVMAAVGLAGTLGVLAVSAAAHAAGGTTMFTSSGTYAIPAGAGELAVTVVGSAGQAISIKGSEEWASPGNGSQVSATIKVPNGVSTLYVNVGVGGGSSAFGGDGGGESDISTCAPGGCTLTGDPSTDPRLVVAGGGGGGGENSFESGTGGGPGGGADGSNSTPTSGFGAAGTDSGAASSGGGTGFTQGIGSAGAVGTGSGNCGSGGDGSVGTPGQGGTNTGGDDSGGGGGAGWVGGSAGGEGDCLGSGGAGGGGGAGLSFVESSADNVSVTTPSTGPEVLITVADAAVAPAIVSPSTTNFALNTSSSFTVSTTGDPAPSINQSGTLPPGVNYTDNGDGTGTLSGTPTATGSYPFTLTAFNNGGTVVQDFTLDVVQAPSITSGSSTSFTVGSVAASTWTVLTSGFPTPTNLSEVGALPSGVTFTNNDDGTAKLTGTPAAGTGGSYPLTFVADNGVLPDATQAFTLTVNQAPAITSGNATTFAVGVPGTFTPTASGYPNPTITESGSLPNGVTFSSGKLSGTPVAGTGGTYPITINASNGVGSNAGQSFTLTVDQGPAITSDDTATFTVGTAGPSFNVTTTGFPHPSLTESGALPSGLIFSDNGDGTATLDGTPAAGTGNSYPITITATNGSATTSQAFTLVVDQGPAITSAAATTFAAGSPGSFRVTASGFPAGDPGAALNITESGALPSGVSFTDNGNGSATLSGTPAAGTGGTYPITIHASNGVGSTASQSFTLTVDEAPSITSDNATTFVVGSAGNFAVTASGFPPPTITESGALPYGVTFSDGTLSGTPAAGTGGSYPLTLTASNGIGTSATQAFTLTVGDGPAITSGTQQPFTIGEAGSFTVTGVGHPTPVLTEKGALPAGVTFSSGDNSTGTFSGTPRAGTAGSYPVVVTATNGNGTVSRSFTLHVAYAPGYIVAGANGEVVNFERSPSAGALPRKVATSGVVGAAETPDTRGYWLLTSAGTVYGVGDAHNFGSPPKTSGPFVAITGTPDGGGYWVLGANGGVFSFGTAHYEGSLPGLGVSTRSAVGMTATPDGRGYDIVTSNGAVYSFGHARYRGGANTVRLHSPIVAITLDAATGGYWLAGQDGGVFSYGAPFLGAATGLTVTNVVGIATTPDSHGYWLVERDGALLPFGDAGAAGGGIRQTGLSDTVAISSATP